MIFFKKEMENGNWNTTSGLCQTCYFTMYFHFHSKIVPLLMTLASYSYCIIFFHVGTMSSNPKHP